MFRKMRLLLIMLFFYPLLNAHANSFATIPAGTYKIGTPDTELDRRLDKHRHSMKLSAYDISEIGVIQEDYARITTGSRRVLWGCSHTNTPEDCRSAFLDDISPNKKRGYGQVGLRLLRTPRKES